VIDNTGERTANARNTLSVPSRTTVNVGARYRLRIGDAPVVLRGQIINATNTFGWNVGKSGFFTPIAARSFSLSVTADF
jgi:iron complex outermembrane recepter protein